MDEFGLKELYEVIIRTTYPIEVSGKTLQTGEVIAYFDKIQIANIQEIKSSVTARGGWDNRGLVYWDSTREIRISLTQGIFNKQQFSLMTNAKLIKPKDSSFILSKREYLETDTNGVLELTEEAINPIFVYKAADGEKQGYAVIDATHLQVQNAPYMDVIVDYSYLYKSPYQQLIIGQALTNGFLSLEGKTRVKDDITGQTHTGILYIPKLKLMSDLSMRLGANASPQVGRLDAIAVPTGDRKNTAVMHVVFLDDDIDSDI